MASRHEVARPPTVVRSPALGVTAISLGFLMITLDATIVNVALGPIGNDLGGVVSTAQWIINGYTLAFAALLLTAGTLADRLGLRTGFLAGLAVFAVGSAAGTGATSLAELIAAHVAQGAGAAALMPCSLALIAHTFPDPEDRRRALGVWGGDLRDSRRQRRLDLPSSWRGCLSLRGLVTPAVRFRSSSSE